MFRIHFVLKLLSPVVGMQLWSVFLILFWNCWHVIVKVIGFIQAVLAHTRDYLWTALLDSRTQCTYHKLYGQPENKVWSQCSATVSWASATRLSLSEATSVQDSMQIESHQSNFVDDLVMMFIRQLVACGPALVSHLDGCTQLYRQSNWLASQ